MGSVLLYEDAKEVTRKKSVTATDEYKREKSPWGTRDRANT